MTTVSLPRNMDICNALLESDRTSASPPKYKQGRRFLPKMAKNSSHQNLEGMKEVLL
jgi:hypothetical protein